MRVRSYFRYKSDPARVVIQLLTFLRCQRAFSLETRLAVACRQTTCLFLGGLPRVSLGQKSPQPHCVVCTTRRRGVCTTRMRSGVRYLPWQGLVSWGPSALPFCCIGGTLRLLRPLTCGVVLVVLVLLQQLRRLLLHQITECICQFFPHRLHIAVARSLVG